MTAYYAGDIPAEDMVIEPARNGDPISLEPFTEADSTVVLRDSEGTIVPADFLLTFDGEQLVLEWPGTTVLESAGLYTLTVTLEGAERRERLAPVYIVVQGDNGWLTIDATRQEWDSAPYSDVQLFRLLALARQQVESYGRPLAEDDPIPTNYVDAQLAQARNLWNAARVDPANASLGEGQFVIRPFPMDWTVKNMIRPKRAIPVVA